MNDYEMAGKIIEMAHRAFPLMYQNLVKGCLHSEKIGFEGKVKEDISRIV
jgi:hypothetical protein